MRSGKVKTGQKLVIETVERDNSNTAMAAVSTGSRSQQSTSQDSVQQGTTVDAAEAKMPRTPATTMPVKEPVQKVAKAEQPKDKSTAVKAAQPTNYKVRNGDTLDKIAKRHGTTAAAIRKANGMAANDSRIRAGQTLKLPAPGTGITKKSSKKRRKK